MKKCWLAWILVAFLAPGCGGESSNSSPMNALYESALDAPPIFKDLECPVNGVPPIAAAVAHLNADGLPDVAVFCSAKTASSAAHLGIHLGTSLQLDKSHTLPGTSAGFCVADMNGDGMTDFVVATPGDSKSGVPGRIMVLLHGNDGLLIGEQDCLNGFDPASVEAADVNGDMMQDLIASGRSSTFVILGPKFDTIATLDFPSRHIAADFNNDGRDEMALASDTSEAGVAIYAWTEKGLSKVGSFQTADPVTAMAKGDLNGDGIQDLVLGLAQQSVAYLTSEPISGAVSVMAGDGAFGFTPWAHVEVVGAPSALAVGNLDGAVAPDIAWCAGSTLGTLLGTGAGYDVGPTQTLTGTATHLAAADLDQKGQDDLIVCDGCAKVYFSELWIIR